jgi:hypothetical protein
LNKNVPMSEMSPLIKEILDKGGSVTITVTGNSMRPLLRHRRDKVCIEKPGEHPLNKYDIPLYIRGDGKYILHRIVAIGEEGYVTLGDNQWNKEYPVWYSQAIGVVTGIWRNGRYISCDSFRYRSYCRLWSILYPSRWVFLRGRQLLH